jgi:hypothetical protein
MQPGCCICFKTTTMYCGTIILSRALKSVIPTSLHSNSGVAFDSYVIAIFFRTLSVALNILIPKYKSNNNKYSVCPSFQVQHFNTIVT